MTLNSGIFADSIVSDKEERLRTYFHTIGLSQPIYWIANFVFDFFTFIPAAFLLVYLMEPLDLIIYTENSYEIYLLTAAFGFQLISTTYFLSFAFA